MLNTGTTNLQIYYYSDHVVTLTYNGTKASHECDTTHLKKVCKHFAKDPQPTVSLICLSYFAFPLLSKRSSLKKGCFNSLHSVLINWMHSGGTPNTNHKGSHPHPMWKLITNLDITQEVLQFSPIQNSIQKRNETEQSVFFYRDGCSFCCQCLIAVVVGLLRIAIYFFYQRSLGCLACNYKLRLRHKMYCECS